MRLIWVLTYSLLGLGTMTQAQSPDFNGNGQVDLGDFFLFADAFGGSDAAFDLDSGGVVDLADFFIFANQFGQEILVPGSRYVTHRLLPVGAEVALDGAGEALELISLSGEGNVEYDEAAGVARCVSGGTACVRLRYRDDPTENNVQTQCFACIDQTGDCADADQLGLDLEIFLQGGAPGDGNYLSQGDQLFYGICQRDGAVVLQQPTRALPPLMFRLVDAFGPESATGFGDDEIPIGRQTRLTTYSGESLSTSWLALMGGGSGNLQIKEDGTIALDNPDCNERSLIGNECSSATDMIVAGDILALAPPFPSDETVEELLTPANGDLLAAFVAAHGITSWDAITALADSGASRNIVHRLLSSEVRDVYLRFFDGKFGLVDNGIRVAMRPAFTSVLGNVCLPEDTEICAAAEVELAAAEARRVAGWKEEGFDVWVMYFLRHDSEGGYSPLSDLAPDFSPYNGVVFDVNTNANAPDTPAAIETGLVNAVRGAAEEIGSLPVVFSPWAGPMSFYTEGRFCEGEICNSDFGNYYAINEALLDAALTHFQFEKIEAFVIPLLDGGHFDIRDPQELEAGGSLNRVGETGYNNPLLNMYLSR